MKTYLIPSLKLTIVLIIICSALYPMLIAGIGKLSRSGGNGETVIAKGRVVGYANIGQKFIDAKYFQGRPSAVDYNAAGSGGSNKGPSNADYLSIVKARIDTFLAHNPGIQRSSIPSELVTASGSGLDPDLSIEAAKIQVPRIARLRRMSEKELITLIDKLKEKPFFGPEKINVLKLNITLNNL